MANDIIITPASASIQFSGSANSDSIRLQVEASGSVAFYGNSGSLFSITDSLSGSLMSVNDASGLPILEVFSDDCVVMGSVNRNTLVVSGSQVRIGGDGAIELKTRVNMPTPPSSGGLEIYSRDFADRPILSMVGPRNVPTPFQPGFFNNNIQIIGPNSSNILTAFGNVNINVGTVSHPVPTENIGWMANIATGAGTPGTVTSASVAFSGANIFRGSTPSGSGGWFFSTRLAFPDTAYTASNLPESSSRFFVGLTTNTMNGVALNPSTSIGVGIGFQLQLATGDTTWSIVSRDGTNLTRQTTNMGFDAVLGAQFSGSVYDFYLSAAPAGTVVGWRIDNLRTGQSNTGQISGTLPPATAVMRGGFDFAARARQNNIRMQRIYLESDR